MQVYQDNTRGSPQAWRWTAPWGRSAQTGPVKKGGGTKKQINASTKAENMPLPKVRPYTIIISSPHASTSHVRIKFDNKNMQIWDNSEMTQAMRAVEVRVPEQHVRASGRKAVRGDLALRKVFTGSLRALRQDSTLKLRSGVSQTECWAQTRILRFLNTIPAPVEAIETIIFSELIISYFIPLIQAYENKTN